MHYVNNHRILHEWQKILRWQFLPDILIVAGGKTYSVEPFGYRIENREFVAKIFFFQVFQTESVAHSASYSMGMKLFSEQ